MSSTVRLLKPLNPQLNPICHLPPLLGAHHILHVSRVRVKVRYALRLVNVQNSTLVSSAESIQWDVKRRDNLVILGVDWRIILKGILKEIWGKRMDWIFVGQDLDQRLALAYRVTFMFFRRWRFRNCRNSKD